MPAVLKKLRSLFRTAENLEAPESVDDLAPGQISRDPAVEEAALSALHSGGQRLINPEFNPLWLRKLRVLSLTNPDLSQATDNVIRLGNTGHTIKAEGPEEEVRRLHEAIEDMADDIYPWGGGWDGLVNDLLGQLARYGALSVEWVPEPELTDLSHATLVPTETIRFRARADGRFDALQKIRTRESIGDKLIELNPHTFVYLAAERTDASPHGVPPFLAALRNVEIQSCMVDQLKFISEKLGLLGLLQILVKAPVPKPGETADQYRRRADTYLKTVVDRIEGSFKKGIAVGFKDLQEFTVTDTKANPSGFKELFQINEEQIASGVKMDPSMLGRSYSTTETYAGVVMERTLALLTSYQRLVAQALRRGIWLLALLRGINVTKITVEFAESNLVDQKSREEVREKKLKNARGMYDQGLIDQEGVAQEMGIAEPALPGPRNVAPAPPGEGGEAEEEPRPGDQEEEDDAELGAFGPLIQFLRRRRQAREDAE